MGKSVLRDLGILLLIAAFLLLGGYYLARKIWYSDFDLSYKVSYQQEEKLGEGISRMILNQYAIVENNAADTALHQISERLLHALDSSHYRYQFVIIKSSQINAFTVPEETFMCFPD